jgi:predicted nucleotidyltransferase
MKPQLLPLVTFDRPNKALAAIQETWVANGLTIGDSHPMINISELKPEIERVCRAMPVKRLGIFGSALTGDFGPASDVDVLVVFDTGENVDLFDAYFNLKERLEEVFGREVELTVDNSFKNAIFKESVEKTKTVVYECL